LLAKIAHKGSPLNLQDVDSIVAKLDGVLLSVAVIAIIFVALLVFNRKNTLTSLIPLATIILGFSFIFGHSAQILFESVSHFEDFTDCELVPDPCAQLIFIFSTHVFDVGDLVMIDDQVCFRHVHYNYLAYTFIT
jgi:hypothetical protein